MIRLLAAILFVGLPMAAAARPFTFRDAEFMPVDDGIAAAQAFVAARLIPGLPASEARQRLRNADMRCSSTRPNGTIACDFAEVVHVEGGTLGETHWTVALVLDSADRVAAASLDHYTIGSGAPGL